MRLTEMFSEQILLSIKCPKGKHQLRENTKLRLVFLSKTKADRNGHTSTHSIYIEVLQGKGLAMFFNSY